MTFDGIYGFLAGMTVAAVKKHVQLSAIRAPFGEWHSAQPIYELNQQVVRYKLLSGAQIHIAYVHTSYTVYIIYTAAIFPLLRLVRHSGVRAQLTR